MVSSHDPLPYLSGLAQQCLINRFLPSILLLLYSFQFQDFRINPYFFFLFFLERFLIIYYDYFIIQYKISPNRSKSYNNFPLLPSSFIFLLIYDSFPIFSTYILSSNRSNISKIYIQRLYIYLSRSPHTCFSPQFFTFRTIPISKETFNIVITLTTVGWKNFHERGIVRDTSNDRWSLCPVHRSSPDLLRGASRVNTVTILISCAIAGRP